MISAVVSSGVDAIATTADTAVEAIPAEQAAGLRNCRVVNTAAAPGFVSFNGGGTWHYLAAATATVPYTALFNNIGISGAIQVKRVASGSNITVFVSAWQ